MADLETRVIDGNEAQYILEHPQFNKAFEAARDSLISQMRSVKPRDVEMHSELIRRMQTLDAIERYFRQTIETGKMAQREIDARKKRRLYEVNFAGVRR